MTDSAIGTVLQTLKRHELDRNTVVVVTSDNGAHWLPEEIAKWGHRANADLRGQKADIHEGGHRVPLLVRWPGKTQAGRVERTLTCLTDLYATFADVVKASPGQGGEDSRSILPAILGQPAPDLRDRAIVHHSLHGHFAIRKGKWKLQPQLGSGGFTEPIELRSVEGGSPGELFDLESDPAERRNVWAQYPEVVRELGSLLDTYRRQNHSRQGA